MAKFFFRLSTIALAPIISAIWSIPGGYDEKGTPTFINTAWFQLFVGANAIAFASILLSIILLAFIQLTHDRLKAQEFLKYGIVLQIIGIISILIMQTINILIAYEGIQKAVIPIIISLIAFAVIPRYVVVLCIYSSDIWSEETFDNGEEAEPSEV